MIGNIMEDKMIGGSIKRYNGQTITGPSIDDYFDPVTHTATEANFIRFLEAGIYTSDVIGYKVMITDYLNNSLNSNMYTIIDLDHDSSNTGQTNCYDLLMTDIFAMAGGFYWSKSSAGYNNSPYTSNFRETYIRTYLNNSYYNALRDIKYHMLNIKYNSCGSWYNDDKIILPSYREMDFWWGFNTPEYYFEEGIPYSIFTDNNSRIKKYNGSANYYWTRTYDKLSTSSGYNTIMAVTNSGSYNGFVVNVNTIYIAPLIRVQ